jgi:NodT family efflux transporter outer membrane factor (OMF) lipoprotein
MSNQRFAWLPSLLVLALTGCATGPDFNKPSPAAPPDWASWHSGADELRPPVGDSAMLPPAWWRVFKDPVLDRLEQRAIDTSPDLRTAALHFAQARVQRAAVLAQGGPQVTASGAVTRERQSENTPGTRLIDAVGGDRERIASILGQPFTLYQAGFDASWEPDLWGRIRRSVEAADAGIAEQAALLDLARLGLASEVARNYFELRTVQGQIRVTRAEIAALDERLELLEARMKGGVIDHIDPQRQHAELAAIKAQLPAMLAQEGASINQIALLLGQEPGSLKNALSMPQDDTAAAPPDLALGLPSEVALRRPDIRAAEARLHAATAGIGIARADLYPSIRLGGHFGFESFLNGEFADWGSRTWSVGPSVSLPLFDHGRRKSVVQLRELGQQEAAITYQQTVRKAWQEIDDALSAYAAQLQELRKQAERVQSAEDVYALARARYDGGMTDFIAVLDSQRSLLQARRDLVISMGRVSTRFIMINKAIGNI